MFGFEVGAGVGFVVGAILIGFIANRRPSWFAKVVSVANAVDNTVNTATAKVTSGATGATGASK